MSRIHTITRRGAIIAIAAACVGASLVAARHITAGGGLGAVSTPLLLGLIGLLVLPAATFAAWRSRPE